MTTWNINSVRLRIGLVEHFLDTHQPDVLCLQETKCPTDAFPASSFAKRGYHHMAINGQKGYHGVAILSRLPLDGPEQREYCGIADTRHVSAIVAAGGRLIRIHNFYVPAGGDEPDRAINPKFGHKLDFIEEMKSVHSEAETPVDALLVGDLNIAPLETDVWSHKQLLNVVSHTPVETEGLLAAQAAGNWVDLMRVHTPPDEKLFTWWSYRARDWDISDRGRRLDHVWSSAGLKPHLRSIEVLREARGWEKPSDHVPVTARFSF